MYRCHLWLTHVTTSRAGLGDREARAEGKRGGDGEGGDSEGEEGDKHLVAGDAGSSAGGGEAGESDPNPAAAGGEEGVGCTAS